jgi:hypothetical protein
VNPYRSTAIALGILLISGIVLGILNSVPALEHPDYLAQLSGIRTQVLIAAFLQSAMAAVYVWIAVLFYQTIKIRNTGFAMGYFGFRIIGAAFLFFGTLSLLLLLWLSQSYASAGQPISSHFQTLGELLRRGRDLINHIGMILPWTIGGLLLYYCFYKTKLVPRWLSAWGIVGSSLTLLATILLMLDFINIVTPAYFILNTPAALFELVLAIYLFYRGFNPIGGPP